MIAFKQHIWNAKVYQSNSSLQMEAALKMLHIMDFRDCNHVIDLGCGDGKITAYLSSLFPKINVIGLDNSAEMIDIANQTFPKKNYPNLNFVLQDIRNFIFPMKFDRVISFFALQWVNHLSPVFQSIYQNLSSEGQFAFIIPQQISLEFLKAVEEVIALPQWIEYFYHFSPGWVSFQPFEIEQLLRINQFGVKRIETVLHKTQFSMRSKFEQFVLPWFTHLTRIPASFKQEFCKQIFDKYLELIFPLSSQAIPYQYMRMEVLAGVYKL
jgi:trans-aconitate methyltransferase